ncbi:DUF47 domain-containing protein [Acidianus brierleyi]|uniref:DUF47 domain-containing protein n=1 Tax=Acidianus brierleyi TaxID=41673 RepID=A0A2U9IDY8_9CREN|nr:DUF47 family protein [Acidianus brierleyi]AWR94186.1 DUF47 family protein [Acidianus brierleyi]
MIKLTLNKEQLLFSKVLQIAESIKDASNRLTSLYINIFKQNYDASTMEMVKIKGIYEKIALVREDIVSMLYGEAFLPDFKESMMMLTQSLYETMKAIKDSGRAISSRKPDEKLCKILQENLLSYLSTISEASEKLVEMISLLQKDIGEAVKVGKEIQLLERNGDNIKDGLIQRLYESEKDSDIISILQLKDVTIFLDDILDNMEETSLSIETLYATLKS